MGVTRGPEKVTYFHMHLFSIDWPTFNDKKTRLEIYNTRLRRTGLNFLSVKNIYICILFTIENF